MQNFLTAAVRNKKIFIPIAALILVGVVAGLVSMLKNDSPEPVTQTHAYIDWLKPKTEIKVGNNRYVSPCQILSKNHVEATYGALKDDASTTENYLDTTSAAPQDDLEDSAQTSCEYTYQKSLGQSVSVNAEQYYDTQEVNDLTSSMFVEPEELSATLTRFDKVAKKGPPEAKLFAAQLHKSVANYKVADSTPYDEVKPLNAYNGTLLPDVRTLALGSFEFSYKFNNVVYEYKYSPPKSEHKKSFDQYSDTYLADLGAKFYQTFAAIGKNAGNPKLSQSPVQTVLGPSDTFGTTKLLDPCSIADTASFSTLFGEPDNRPIQRLGFDVDSTSGKADKSSDTLKGSTCVRLSENVQTGSRKNVDLLLRMGASTAQTTKWINREFNTETIGVTKKIQSNADMTFSYTSDPEDPELEYYFQVGPYVGTIHPSYSVGSSLSSDGDDQPVDQAAAINAINVMVANLKRDLLLAQKQ